MLAGPPYALWTTVVIPFLITVSVFVAFWPSISGEFLLWDDDKIIVTNPHFRGFDADNMKWMFTEYKMGHYHPFTWLSYALDFTVGKSLFDNGLDPRAYHVTNLVLHAVSAILFFFLARMLFRMTMLRGKDRDEPDVFTSIAAGAAALFFAVHPLRAETVAWVTERRDVLSMAFLMPAVLCYLRYAAGVGVGWRRLAFYSGSILLLSCSLMSKAWGITLPVVLLVLDVYPLRRLGGQSGWNGPRVIWIAFVEKLPHYALAAVFALKAHEAQGTALNTMKSWQEWTLADRIAQAFYGLFFYSWKTLIPLRLSPIVEIPQNNNPFAAQYLVAAIVVLVVAGLLFAARHRWPAGLALAACYAITLSPVLGFSQSGPQLVADRYSYVACLTWALLFGAVLLRLLRRGAREDGRPGIDPLAGGAAAMGVVVMLCILTWGQSKVWQSSRSLFEQVLRVNPNSVLANSNMGMLEKQAGNLDAAIAHYQAGLKANPNDHIVLNNLANALSRQDRGNLPEAIELMKRAIEIEPHHPGLYFTLGDMYLRQGQNEEALQEFRRCIEEKWQDNPGGHRAMAETLFRLGRFDESAKHWRIALEQERALDGSSDKALFTMRKLGATLVRAGQLEQAVELFEAIVNIRPDDEQARQMLEAARRRLDQGR